MFLALTVEEAAAVLTRLGRPAADPAAVVQATGGWVTGVLFEAWRFGEQATADGQNDPLYDYMSAHILRDLPAADSDFLIATSVLGEVTAARARALGVPDAGTRLASLRNAHIPVTWKDTRAHPALPPPLPRVPAGPAGGLGRGAAASIAGRTRTAARLRGPPRGGHRGPAGRRRGRRGAGAGGHGDLRRDQPARLRARGTLAATHWPASSRTACRRLSWPG